MKNSNKGFTLVELSIVLVIIGLLIGGLLVAQSMIGTTKIQSFVRQVGQFDSAFANFHEKYQGLPGDLTALNTDGNADGMIEDDSATAGSVMYSDEIAGVWPSLSATGLKNEGGAAYANTDDTISPGVTVPSAKAGQNASFVVAYDDSATAADSGHFYYVADFTGTDSTNVHLNLAFTGNDALAIDTKLDDGDPNAGNLNADDAAHNDATGLEHLTNASCPNAYTAGTTTAYLLRIRVGAVSGSLQ